MASMGFSEVTGQSLPAAMIAPVRMTLPIGESPERLEIRDDSQLAEARNVFGFDELQVSDVMPRVSPAIGFLRGFMGIERYADGAIANSMDVHLKALAIQSGN